MPRLLHHISVRYRREARKRCLEGRSGLEFIRRGLHWLRQECFRVPVQKERP